MAEVDLVLDNTDGTIPIDFTEITITRRMFRSGESEYFLNASPARLMDIQDLLSDTGLGRDTHSIISQGRLDAVLNSKPEDRRALIEEAAGILKHKKRKERALSKLKSMEGHADRVRDIIAEIDRQLRPLERAADKATRHAQIETRAARSSRSPSRSRSCASCSDAGRTSSLAEKEQDEALSLSRYRLVEKQRELEKFQALLDERGMFAGDLSDQRRRLAAVLERINAGLLLLEEKGKNLVDRLSRPAGDDPSCRDAYRHAPRGARADHASSAGSTEARLKDLYAALGELRREAETVKKTRLAAEERVAEVNGRDQARAKPRRVDRDRAREAGAARSARSPSSWRCSRERETAMAEARSETATTLSARRQRAERLDRAVTTTRKELALAESDVDKRVRFLESRRRELEQLRDGVTDHPCRDPRAGGGRSRLPDGEPGARLDPVARGEADGLHRRRSPTCSPSTRTWRRLVERALGSDLFCVLVRTRADAALAAQAPFGGRARASCRCMPLDVAAPRQAARRRSGPARHGLRDLRRRARARRRRPRRGHPARGRPGRGARGRAARRPARAT